MPHKSGQMLTDRQLEIAKLLTEHLSLKEIAGELQISESAVNKHVSAIKQVLGAQSRRDIVTAIQHFGSPVASEKGCRKSTGRFSHLPGSPSIDHNEPRNEPGLITFADAGTLSLHRERQLDWQEVFEPRIVPKWLDGENAVLMRLSAVLVLLFVMLALPVVGVATLGSLETIIGS